MIKRLVKKILKNMIKIITLGNAKRYNQLLSLKKKLISKIKHYHYNNACQNGIEIECDIRELFIANETKTKYDRLDTIVRYITIENYYNTFGGDFNLYKKMQSNRLGSDEEAEKWCKRFEDLIKSFEQEGYNHSSLLTIGKDLEMHDGSHRTALCLYHKQFLTKCNIINYCKQVDYGLNWFLNHNFSMKEIKKMVSKYDELIETYKIPYLLVAEYNDKKDLEEIERLLVILYHKNNISRTKLKKDSDEFKECAAFWIKQEHPIYYIEDNQLINRECVLISKILNNRMKDTARISYAYNYKKNEELVFSWGIIND